MAQQPPRLSDVGQARIVLVANRPQLLVHSLARSGPTGLEPAATAYGAGLVNDEFWKEWHDEIQRSLDGDWTKPLRDAGVKVSTHVEEGHAEEVLLRLAREQSVDLIVVGSRGRGHLRGMFLGSVSHALALHAPCPVVVLPHHHPHPAEA